MASAPSFAATPRQGIGQVTAANTNRDGTGTLVDILVAGASGSRIEQIVVQAVVTTTAGVVRLFLNDGTNTRLYKELLVTAITPSATVEAFRTTFSPSFGLVLPTGWTLKASTHNAEAFNVFAVGGDF